MQQQQQQEMTWIQQQPMVRLQKHLHQDQGSSIRMQLEQSSHHPRQIMPLQQRHNLVPATLAQLKQRLSICR